MIHMPYQIRRLNRENKKSLTKIIANIAVVFDVHSFSIQSDKKSSEDWRRCSVNIWYFWSINMIHRVNSVKTNCISRGYNDDLTRSAMNLSMTDLPRGGLVQCVSNIWVPSEMMPALTIKFRKLLVSCLRSVNSILHYYYWLLFQSYQ